jgi:histidine decarboxylase
MAVGDDEASSEELREQQFAVGEGGLADKDRLEALGDLHAYLTGYRKRFLGYQVNQGLETLPSELGRFLDVHTNNIGDPYTDSNLRTHTKPLERAVLAYYARLWQIKPHPYPVPAKKPVVDLNTGWGYVLSMGSSEGNVYGLLNARDYLSGKFLMIDEPQAGRPARMFLAQAVADKDKPNQYRPVIFYSHDTHYSVAKAAHTLAIPTFGEMGNREYPLTLLEPWPLEVPSYTDAARAGTIDVEKLNEFVEFFVEKGHPIVIVLNLGSTYRGAYDNVEKVIKTLAPSLKKLAERTVHYDPDDPTKCDTRKGYWIHIDGALGATYLPFLRDALRDAGVDGETPRVPTFDFSLKEVSSIVTSGHKYPGVPWACGIYMTRAGLQLRPPPLPAYVGAPDTTFGGSRNAFSAIVLWNFIAKHSRADQIKMIAECEKMADKTYELLEAVDRQLKKRGDKHGLRLQRAPYSLSIIFRRPNPNIVRDFSLSNATVPDETEPGRPLVDYSHIYIMPHVTLDTVRELQTRLLADGAFPERSLTPEPETIDIDLFPTFENAEVMVHLAMNRGFA